MKSTVTDNWFWWFGSGGNLICDPSCWPDSHKHDLYSTPEEDNEVNYALVVPGKPHFQPSGAIYDASPTYALCEFAGLTTTSTTIQSTSTTTTTPTTTTALTTTTAPTAAFNFTSCLVAGGTLLNGDCFIVRVAPSTGRASREALCGPEGFPALLHWSSAQSEIVPQEGYLGRYQQTGWSGAHTNKGWYWAAPGGQEISDHNSGLWAPGQPNDGNDDEDDREQATYLRQDMGLVDSTETWYNKTICQYEGPARNLSGLDTDWCQSQPIHKVIGGFCFTAPKDKILRGDQIHDQPCGPNGFLAVINTSALLAAVHNGLAVADGSDILLFVSLFQDSNQTAVGDGWFWRHPDGTKEPMDLALWRGSNPRDDYSTSQEDSERDYGSVLQ